MVYGPMTLIVALFLGVLLAAGLWLLRNAFQSPKADGSRVCSFCKNSNRAEARYCARCGEPLDQRPLDHGSLDDTTLDDTA